MHSSASTSEPLHATSSVRMTEPETAVRPLRVGFYVFFPGGGIGRYTRELMRVMGRRSDVEVEVLCTPDFEWKEGEAYASWAGLRSISHDVPTLRRWRFLCGQFVNPRRAIARAVERELDVLHLANINHLTFPFWRRALARTDVRIVASAHDVKRQKSIVSRVWEDRQLRAFYRFADALFVHSAYQAEELVRFAGLRREKIHVVPHGPYPYGPVPDVDRHRLRTRLDLPADRPVALFFGQLRDEKNLEGLIRALPHSRANPYVVVAGSEMGYRHRSADDYRALARELGVADDVAFRIGFVPDEEVADLFYAADWVALPYDTSFTSQSGVLNVAAHYERPVLVTPSPVLEETVRKSEIGVVCDALTPASIAAGMDRLCELTEAGHVFPFEAYRRNYSWETNVRRTVDVYRRLVASEQ